MLPSKFQHHILLCSGRNFYQITSDNNIASGTVPLLKIFRFIKVDSLVPRLSPDMRNLNSRYSGGGGSLVNFIMLGMS